MPSQPFSGDAGCFLDLPCMVKFLSKKKTECLSGVARGGGTAPTIEEGSNLWPVHFQRYHAGNMAVSLQSASGASVCLS